MAIRRTQKTGRSIVAGGGKYEQLRAKGAMLYEKLPGIIQEMAFISERIAHYSSAGAKGGNRILYNAEVILAESQKLAKLYPLYNKTEDASRAAYYESTKY